jgi:hypothetical protein
VRAARAGLVAVLLGLAVPGARAAPPPVGSEDWQIMAPFSGWIRGLQHEGVVCCTMADGRPVQARSQGDRWQVKWRPGQLEGAPTDWVENPTGMPIAFWLAGVIRCFVPPGGI